MSISVLKKNAKKTKILEKNGISEYILLRCWGFGEADMNKSAKTNAIRLVESSGVAHRVYEYDVSDGRIDALAIAEKIGRTPDEVFKTLVAEAPGHEHFVFIVPAASELDLKKAARAAGRKSSELIPQKQLQPGTAGLKSCINHSQAAFLHFEKSRIFFVSASPAMPGISRPCRLRITWK